MPRSSLFDPLKDAAKYVRAFRDKPFVVKLGGDSDSGPLRAGDCAVHRRRRASGSEHKRRLGRFRDRLFIRRGETFLRLKSAGASLESGGHARSLLPLVDLAKLDELEASGAIQSGMRPKIAAARSALVPSVHLVSGLLSDAILAEVFTNEGSGTMVVTQRPTDSMP